MSRWMTPRAFLWRIRVQPERDSVPDRLLFFRHFQRGVGCQTTLFYDSIRDELMTRMRDLGRITKVI
jgi:hypothetical protein